MAKRTSARKPPPRPRPRNQRGRNNRGASPAALRWVLLGVGVAIVGIVAFVALGTGGDDAAGTTEPEAFDLPAIQGDDRIRLADHQGRPVVVNFFASWCTVCDFELPSFREVSEELRGEVDFIGVDALETGDPMFMPERHDITWWPLAADIGGRNGSGLHEALGGRGMPITAFYDAEGNLLHVEGGGISEQALRERINEFYGVDTL